MSDPATLPASEASEAPPQTRVLVCDEFLVADEWRALLDYTLGSTLSFGATHIIAADGSKQLDHAYRRSRVLFDLGPFQEMFANRLLAHLPHVLSRLDFPAFPVTSMEVQLTGTNDGEYFKMHTDNDADEVDDRALTFVYFFFREPQGYSGGQLRIYDTERDSEAQSGHYRPTGPYRDIYPAQNQVVFFDSSKLHEILPVSCPSREFADSRFTVNGWFHR